MTVNVRHAVGSLLVVGLSGMELTGLEKAWLKLVRPGGVILFKRNIGDAGQTRSLLSGASAFCVADNFRCVDVEGGAVDRLRDALAPVPSAQAVVVAAKATGKPALMRKQGELIARSVQAFGFNTTLAPVLDLALPASAKIMGSRAAAETASGMIEYGRPFLAGLAAHGVVGCGKHFPGLGGGTLDSHLETPAIHRTMKEMNGEDLVPFRALSKELPMIMVNHAAYPRTPGGARPASASPYWIDQVLRKQIGYRGIVFSDDLEMGGILKFLPIEEAAIASIRAGMDLLEVCHSPELILRAYEALLAEADRSSAFRKTVLDTAARLSRKRTRLFAGGTSRALTAKQFDALRRTVVDFAKLVTRAQPATRGQGA